MAYQFQFGSYTLPKGLYLATNPQNRVLPAAKLPRRDGARVLTGTLDKKKLTVRGGLVKSFMSTEGAAALRTQLDALKAALAQGPTTFQTDSDRYYRNCQAEGYSDTYDPTGFNRLVTIQFDVTTGDPFSYSSTATTVTQALSSSPTTGIAVANGGNAPGAPVVNITVSSTATIAATVTNTTTGEAFTLAGAVTSGDVIVIDCLNETVTIGGVDKTALFDGVFPSLAVGANSWSITYSGVTLSQIQWVFNTRFL